MIKFSEFAEDMPAVLRIAAAADLPPHEVIGRLYQIAAWHARHADLEGVVRVTGPTAMLLPPQWPEAVIDAVREVGMLVEDDEGLHFDGMGVIMRTRPPMTSTERARKMRAKQKRVQAAGAA